MNYILNIEKDHDFDRALEIKHKKDRPGLDLGYSQKAIYCRRHRAELKRSLACHSPIDPSEVS